MKVYQTITDLVGRTPLLEVTKIEAEEQTGAKIFAKLELFNPAGSVKDRVAVAMINDAEKRGVLKPDSVIIEPTSGNTGIGLAAVAAARNYRIIIVMPETMSIERRNLMKAYGAELVLTDGAKGMKGAIEKANELAKEIPGGFIPSQFTNPANPSAHEASTGPEIWEDTDGKVDIFVAGVGTGGTVTGVGETIKAWTNDVRIAAVEPYESQALGGGLTGPHGISDLGYGFVPENFNAYVVDNVVAVNTTDAQRAAQKVLRTDAIPASVSAGAALHAAAQLLAELEMHKLTARWGLDESPAAVAASAETLPEVQPDLLPLAPEGRYDLAQNKDGSWYAVQGDSVYLLDNDRLPSLLDAAGVQLRVFDAKPLYHIALEHGGVGAAIVFDVLARATIIL